MHVLDDLPPADAGVVGAERNLAFLGAVRNDAHLGAAKIIIKKILEPHAFDAEHAPVVGGRVLAGTRHAVVAIRVRIGRRRLEEINDLRNRKAFRRFRGVKVTHDCHAELSIGKFLAARRVGNHRHVLHKLFIVEELEQRAEIASLLIHHRQRENAAVRMAIARRPAPRRVRALQHVHHAGERRIR